MWLAGINYRFLPVAVKYENFVFDQTKAAEFVVKYYGVTSFKTSYTGNPQVEVPTTVTNELINVTNATITYESNNTNVVFFETANGKVVLNTKDTGKATVTVKCTYGGITYVEEVEVEVLENVAVSALTVSAAIDSADDTTVIVKGIVGPSVVNKSGFYLYDETGFITVLGDAEFLASVELGHEIVLEGKREVYKKDTTTVHGQTSIVDCKLIANYYGNHEYSQDNLVTNKTLADLYALDPNEDHTTTVFVVEVTIQVEETAYYTNINLISGSTKLGLYCSSANQYNWLKQYAGQTVKVDVAMCNWNDKNYYRGCVLAVYNQDGTKTYNTLNFND